MDNLALIAENFAALSDLRRYFCISCELLFLSLCPGVATVS